MTDDASPEIRDENLKHSERLLALYARQMDVLGRHRIRELKRQDLIRQEQPRQKQDELHQETMKHVRIYSHLRQVDHSLYKKDLYEKDGADHEEWHEGDEQAGAMPENTRGTFGGRGGGRATPATSASPPTADINIGLLPGNLNSQ